MERREADEVQNVEGYCDTVQKPRGPLIGSSLGHYFGIPAEGFIRTQGRRTRLVQPGVVDHVDVVGGKAAPGERRGERGGGGEENGD